MGRGILYQGVLILHDFIMNLVVTGQYILNCFLGEWDGLIFVLTILMILESVTFIMLKYLKKKVEEVTIAEKISRKAAILFLVGVAHILDVHILKSDGALRSVVILFYLGSEGTAFLKNISALGVPIPKKLKDIMSKLREGT